MLGLHISVICRIALSFDQVHFKHNQTQILSPDSHVTINTIHQTQDAANVLWVWRHIVGMRFNQRSYWDSWKLGGRPWRYQHEIWLHEL